MIPAFDILGAFFATSLLLALAPGPDIIFVLTQSALFGSRAGLATTLGLITGLWVHTLAVAFGVAVIFQTSVLAFTMLKTFGVAYLCWLAWLSFRAGSLMANLGRKENFTGYWALYRRGIVMNVTNPKVALFFLAFLPQFCSPAAGGNIAFQVCILGMVFMIAALLVFCITALLGGRLARLFNRTAKMQIALHRIAALVFLGLALALVFTGNKASQ